MWDLIGDIGGTNMRLATAIDGVLRDVEVFPTKGGDHLTDAIASITRKMGTAPARAVIAAAGPIRNGVITLTNSGMRIDQTEIAALTTTKTARVLNDFEAAAWSQVDIDTSTIQTLYGTANFPKAPRLILGPGTGFGVGSIVFDAGRPIVIPGEGGHVSIGAQNHREAEIFATFANLFPEFALNGGFALEAEAVVSGTGLPKLYAAISHLEGGAANTPEMPTLFQMAKDGDAIAQETVYLLRDTLGRVAGDLSLFINATGGVFFCGGVVAANPWLFETPEFVAAFCEGGRFTDLRKTYALHLVTDGAFGLEGALSFLRNTS